MFVLDSSLGCASSHVTLCHSSLCRFEFLALLDIDEVIIPVKHEHWGERMAEIVQKSLAVMK